MGWLNRLSLRYKILAIALVGTLGIFINLYYNYFVTYVNQQRLEQIRDISFPVLEQTDANLVRLDKIKDALQTAAAAGELDSVKEADAIADNIKQSLNHINKLQTDDHENINELNAYFSDYYEVARKFTINILKGKLAAKDLQSSAKSMAEKLKLFENKLSEFRQTNYTIFTSIIDSANTSARDALFFNLTLGFIVILVLCITAYFIARVIATNIKSLVVEMGKLAEGDLTREIREKRYDEIGDIIESYNSVNNGLRKMMKEVKESITQLVDAAQSLAHVSHESGQGIHKQQSETELMVKAIHEMIQAVQEVLHDATSAADVATKANDEAIGGKKVIETTIKDIELLAQVVENASKAFQEVERSSENIGAVLDVIKSIAEQTNLLALNAAIEAARAGDQGRGFAVVADEVRTLASRTQHSTTEIEVMIKNLQAGSRNAVEVIEDGRQHARAGVEQTNKASNSLTAITQAVTSISELNLHIAEKAKVQSVVSDGISGNIQTITEVSETASHGAQRITVTSKELSVLATQLQSLVSKFKLIG